MSYTIKLEQGKYLINNDNGSLTILRHGSPWPAAEELKHVKILGALASRIEELEVTIRDVIDGSPTFAGFRNFDGTGNYDARDPVPVKLWDDQLRNVLKQGE